MIVIMITIMLIIIVEKIIINNNNNSGDYERYILLLIIIIIATNKKKDNNNNKIIINYQKEWYSNKIGICIVLPVKKTLQAGETANQALLQERSCLLAKVNVQLLQWASLQLNTRNAQQRKGNIMQYVDQNDDSTCELRFRSGVIFTVHL